MLEVASGILLALIILWSLPYLISIALYLIPPAIGMVVGRIIGGAFGNGDAVLMGAGLGFLAGIYLRSTATDEN